MIKRKNYALVMLFGLIILIPLLLIGCSPGVKGSRRNIGQITQDFTPTATPFQPLPIGEQPNFDQETVSLNDPASDETAITLKTLEPSKPRLWVDPKLPASLIEKIDTPRKDYQVEKDGANLLLTFGVERIVSHWIYVLAAPFSSKYDAVKLDELRSTWQGNPAGVFSGNQILLDDSTNKAISTLWGLPAESTVRTLPTNELLGTAWNTQSFALLPFEALSPQWKVIYIDGISPVSNKFDEIRYAIRVPISLLGTQQAVNWFLSTLQMEDTTSLIPTTNRNPSKLTVLAMTGVTALVRATAHTMELQGITYPAEDIGDLLRNADLTHISNEVPFASDCPFPNPVQSDVRFCSDERYIQLLEVVGTDLVELTGDHFADWGSPAMYFTLELYDQRGWQYYGGGQNISEGKKPITIEHNGNRLAFIGCNGKGGQFATASEDKPGSVFCDFPYMQDQIRQLVNQGYLPIATFQHFEYYTYSAQPAQQRDFQLLADAGAVIVSGSQAHQPQAFELRGDSLIHYGLGNLFFDQYLIGEPTRQGFIDLHIFYDGRYISTELVTIYFIDFAKPRLMTSNERANLLSSVFSASGW